MNASAALRYLRAIPELLALIEGSVGAMREATYLVFDDGPVNPVPQLYWVTTAETVRVRAINGSIRYAIGSPAPTPVYGAFTTIANRSETGDIVLPAGGSLLLTGVDDTIAAFPPDGIFAHVRRVA